MEEIWLECFEDAFEQGEMWDFEAWSFGDALNSKFPSSFPSF
jgi:hypothetical protein